MGKISERWNLHHSFCSEYGSRNDFDHHCFPHGMAADVQAQKNVNVCVSGYFHGLQKLGNVLRFLHMKTRGKREYMCTPHYREIPRRIQAWMPDSGTERDVQVQMEDGFGGALPNIYQMPGNDRTACYSGRV